MYVKVLIETSNATKTYGHKTYFFLKYKYHNWGGRGEMANEPSCISSSPKWGNIISGPLAYDPPLRTCARRWFTFFPKSIEEIIKET